jgi:nucleoside permease NupC
VFFFDRDSITRGRGIQACGNHLLSASVMSAPAALSVAKLFYPETEVSKTKEQANLDLGES